MPWRHPSAVRSYESDSRWAEGTIPEYTDRQVSTFTLAMVSASSMAAGLIRTASPFYR
jgi:hypothetical protein